jgi:hypothetical protein
MSGLSENNARALKYRSFLTKDRVMETSPEPGVLLLLRKPWQFFHRRVTVMG